MPRKKKEVLKQRPDGRYRVKYHGQEFYGRSSDEALALRDDYIRQQERGQYIHPRTTVRQYAAEWLPIHKAGVSAKCYNDYACQIEKLFPVLGDKPLSEVTVDDVARLWLSFDGMSASLIKRARMLYIALFDTAIENDLCNKNPFRSKFAAPPKGTVGSHRALTDEEIELIKTVPHRMQLGTLVMLFAGLRRGEVLPLSIPADIDLKTQILAVSRAVRFVNNQPVIVDPKTEAGRREIPIFSPLRPYLTDRIGLVCPSAAGKIMSDEAFRRGWASYMHHLSKAAGHPVSFRPHDCRHTFCTMLRDAGVELKQAMIWMGHSDEKMILHIYDHVREERTKGAVNQVESLFRGQNGGQGENKKAQAR